MAGVVYPEMAGIGFDNQILHQISKLNYIRQPALHNTG
jgi:uncharacterized protein (UPF0335 family)